MALLRHMIPPHVKTKAGHCVLIKLAGAGLHHAVAFQDDSRQLFGDFGGAFRLLDAERLPVRAADDIFCRGGRRLLPCLGSTLSAHDPFLTDWGLAKNYE